MGRFTNIRRWGLSVAAILLAVIGTFGYNGMRALAATSYEVSGTITSQSGSGIQNVSITATEPGSATVVSGPVTSGIDGSYQISVEEGTYDIHFKPPSSSGLSELVQSNVSVHANRTVSVQLIPATETHTLSGTVTDYHGDTVSGLQVWLDGDNILTDSNGHFSLTAAAGTHDVRIRKDSQDAPEYPYFWLPQGSVDLTNTDIVHNYQLPPVLHLSVTVLNANGTPKNGQSVQLTNDPIHLLETATASTNKTGVATLPIIQGVVIPAGSVCATFNPGNTTVCNTQAVTADQDTSLTLTAPDQNLQTISGTVTDANGVGIQGLDVKLDGSNTAGAKTDSTGHYTYTTTPGVHELLVTKDDSSYAKAYPYFTISAGPISLTTGTTTKDIQLPALHTLTVTVTDPSGTPMSGGVQATVGNRYEPGNEATSGNTNAVGVATLPVLDGNNFPAGSVCAFIYNDTVCNTTTVVVDQDVSLALQGPVVHTISGKLLDATGAPVKNTRVELNGYGVTTTKNGDFSITVKAGVYDLGFRSYESLPGYPFFTLSEGPVDLTTTDITANYNLPPLVHLTVTVKDKDGNPIPQQTVYIQEPADFGSGGTNASGIATLPVFDGQTIGVGGICTVFPGDGYTCNKTAIPINGDTSFLFQQSSSTTPTAPAAPTNVAVSLNADTHPVVTWNAVTGATYYRIYRDGINVDQTTNLQSTDENATTGEHTYYVMAVDSNNLSSDPSSAVTILVPEPADTTPPTVSNFLLPNKNVHQNLSFNVSATDDSSGVAAGEFFYGADPGLGNGTQMTYTDGQLHGTLSSNVPAGVYTISVRAKDNAGNWSEPQKASLTVTGASVSRARGQQISFYPTAGSDVLPNMSSATILNTAQATFNVNYIASGISNSSTFTFTYNTGNVLCGFLPGVSGCHTFSTTMTSVNSFQLYGTNYSKARITGIANVTIDGTTTSHPFVAEITDGNRVNGSTQDSYELRIYETGANPDTATPLYHVAKSVSRTSITIQ